jgi:hypothetical protein
MTVTPLRSLHCLRPQGDYSASRLGDADIGFLPSGSSIGSAAAHFAWCGVPPSGPS